METYGKAVESYGTQVQGFAEAQRQLSSTFGKVGQLMTESALDFQKLKNETEAKDLFFQGLAGVGQLNQELFSKEGMNFVNSVPGYQQKLLALRERLLKQASNPEAARLVDQQIHRFIGYKLEDAGSRAGTEMLKANRGATKDALDSVIENGSLDDTSDTEFKTGLKTVADFTRQNCENTEGGTIAADCELQVKNAQSTYVLKSIKNTKDPDKAQQALDRYAPFMRKDHLAAAVQYVRESQGNAMATNDADRILKGESVLEGWKRIEPYRPDMTPEQKQIYLDRINEAKDTKGYSLGLYTHYGNNLAARANQAMKQLDEAHYNKVATNVQKLQDYLEGGPGNMDPSKRIVNMDAVVGPKAPPEMDAIYRSLDGKGQKAVFDTVSNLSRTVAPSPGQSKRFNDLIAWVNEHPKEAATTVISGEDLPQWMINAVRAKQDEMLNKRAPSGYYNNVLVKDLETLANSIGVKRDPTEGSRWMKLRGIFDTHMEEFKNRNGRYPGQNIEDQGKAREEILGNIKILMPEVRTQEGTFWNTYERRFEIKVPPAEVPKITKDFEARYGYTPSADQIRYWYFSTHQGELPERK